MKPAELEGLTGIARRFGAFVAERHPFALAAALDAFEAATGGRDPNGEAAFEALPGKYPPACSLPHLRSMVLRAA